MENLKELSLAALIDMLDKHTNYFLKMFKTGASKEEYNACKDIITSLTAEIKTRKEEKTDVLDMDSLNSMSTDRAD